MRTDPYRVFGWLIPGLCMAVSAFVFYRQIMSLADAQRQRDLAAQGVQTASAEKSAVDSRVAETRFAAAEASDKEQTDFLSDLKRRVALSGAVITNWTSQAAQYGASSKPDSAVNSITPTDPKDAELLKGITRVSSTLTLSGSYQAIRSFLGDLQKSDRLFTLSNVNWTRTKEGTTLLVTISRYIAPPGQTRQATISGMNP